MMKNLRYQTNVANAFNNFFITITEKSNIQHTAKGDAISLPKDSFPVIFSSTEIITIMEAKLNCIVCP
jgi:hypothetical protein